MDENIYITSLEIGKDRIEEGITYPELKAILTDKGFEFDEAFEWNFKFWFYSNFYCYQVFFMIQKDMGVTSKDGTLETEYKIAKNKKAFLTGDAHSKYIEYVELKEARETAITSMRQSKKAFSVAIATLLLSILISGYTIWDNQATMKDATNILNQISVQEKEGFDSLYKVLEDQTNVLQNSISELAQDSTLNKLVQIQTPQ